MTRDDIIAALRKVDSKNTTIAAPPWDIFIKPARDDGHAYPAAAVIKARMFICNDICITEETWNDPTLRDAVFEAYADCLYELQERIAAAIDEQKGGAAQ